LNPVEMIDELIKKVGSDAEHIIANGLGMTKPLNKNYRCPNHTAHNHGDKEASMSWVSDRYFFNCFACGENIDIYKYYRNYCNYTFNEIMSDNGIKTIDEKRKNFKEKIKSNGGKLLDNQKEYLKSRGISENTYNHFRVGNYEGKIAFSYFRNGHIIGTKLRNFNTKEQGSRITSVPDSKFFFYNSDNTVANKPLIICEGEIDCMTLFECGYHNVVSVGCGATSLQTLFEQASEWLSQFEDIIIVSDNDKAGIEMQERFLDTFGDRVALVNKNFFGNDKDINDVFLNQGKEAVDKIITSGKKKIDGEWDLDEEPYTALDDSIYTFIPTGIEKVDMAINDIQSGTVTLITGRSNAGKSTFVNQIVASAVSNDKKVYLALGEGDRLKVINKWYTSIIGYDSKFYNEKKFNKRIIKEPKKEVLEALRKWHHGKLKLYVKAMGNYKTTADLFKLLAYVIKRNNYDLIVLDNLMSLLKVESSKDKLDEQAKFVEQCHHIAQGYNVSIVLVLHPNKTYRKGDDMDFEQIAGTSDISNKADVIISVVRYDDNDKLRLKTDADNQIQVIKNRDWPDLPKVDCKFDKSTGTYAEIDTGYKAVEFTKWQQYLPGYEKVTQQGFEPLDDSEPIPF